MSEVKVVIREKGKKNPIGHWVVAERIDLSALPFITAEKDIWMRVCVGRLIRASLSGKAHQSPLGGCWIKVNDREIWSYFNWALWHVDIHFDIDVTGLLKNCAHNKFTFGTGEYCTFEGQVLLTVEYEPTPEYPKPVVVPETPPPIIPEWMTPLLAIGGIAFLGLLGLIIVPKIVERVIR